MELFGLLFAVPATFAASLTFCVLAHFVFRRSPRVQYFCTLGAALVVVSLIVETSLSLWIGPLRLDHRFGIFYWILHGIGFFFGPPAIGVLVFVTVSRFVRFTTVRVGLATAVCWIVCMATLLANIMVDEDINGIKSSGSRPRNSR